MHNEMVNTIATEVARAIMRGEFTEQLPGRSVMMKRYGGSVNTWVKVYDLLERWGKVTMVRGRGAFIAEVPFTASEKAYHALVVRLQSGLFVVGNVMPPAPLLASEYDLTERGVYGAYELLVAEGFLVTHGNQTHIVSNAPCKVELTQSVQRAQAYMIEKIKSGDWASGEYIPYLKRLQEWAHYSRESLVCAAELLVRKGLLLPTHNRRYRVVQLEQWPEDL